MRSYLQRYLSDLRAGNAGKPVFDTLVWDWIQDAWIYTSAELGEDKVRSGALLVRLTAHTCDRGASGRGGRC